MHTRTRVILHRNGSGTRAELRGDVLRPVLQRRGDRPLVALVGAQLLLLGGDTLSVEIVVGDGVRAELRDVAAVVCQRGAPASWATTLTLGDDAELTWHTEPCIVADGADVTRSTHVEAAPTARTRLRDTVVLGRSGEAGGRLRSDTRLTVGGEDVLVEQQVIDERRHLPGLLGPHRVLDTMLSLGPPRREQGEAATTPAPALAHTPGVLLTPLVDGTGHLARWLGSEVADSPFAGAAEPPGLPGPAEL